MKAKLRRSGAKIMASLIVLLDSLSYIMILAVINGSVGFIRSRAQRALQRRSEFWACAPKFPSRGAG